MSVQTSNENPPVPSYINMQETMAASTMLETIKENLIINQVYCPQDFIFLKPGGRFELTPVYDVISAYPLTKARQLEYRNLKMAMALHTKNTHYEWYEIMPRHWFDESKKIDFPDSEMLTIIENTLSKIETVIMEVNSKLPDGFPDNIASPIFDEMRKMARRF